MRTVHAARPGTPGDHRTDGLQCKCEPFVLADINEPAVAVLVHRPMPTAVTRAEAVSPGRLAVMASSPRSAGDPVTSPGEAGAPGPRQMPR